MDSMVLKSDFLKGLVSKAINKLLWKPLNINPDIKIDEFSCSSKEDQTYIQLEISLPTHKFWKILQEVIK